MKKTITAVALLAALASCKKELADNTAVVNGVSNTQNNPIPIDKATTAIDWTSTRNYSGGTTNGEYLNFTWDGLSSAFAHNVYGGANSPSGYQTLYATLPWSPTPGYTYTAMNLNIYHPGGGALPYPKIKKNFNVVYNSTNVPALSSYVKMTLPAAGTNLQYNAAFDIYFDYPPYQGTYSNYLAMMVWLNQVGPYGPAGETLYYNNGTKSTFTAQDGTVYRLVGRNTFLSHYKIINFVRQTQIPQGQTSESWVNLKEMMDFVHNTNFTFTDGNGPQTLQTNLIGATLRDINIGWEVHKAYTGTNTPVDFRIDKYRVSYQ